MVAEQTLFGIIPLIWAVNPFSDKLKRAEDKIFSSFFMYIIVMYIMGLCSDDISVFIITNDFRNILVST